MIARRAFLGGLLSAMAAPSIIRPGLLMPVRALPAELLREHLLMSLDIGGYGGISWMAMAGGGLIEHRPGSRRVLTHISAENHTGVPKTVEIWRRIDGRLEIPAGVDIRFGKLA